MSSRLNPYISFNGTAREALDFYHDVFGGDLSLNTYGEFGSPDAPIADKVMHGMIEAADGLTLMVSDVPPGVEYQPGGNIAISLSGDDAEELRGYWAKLSDGGLVTVALEKQVWGDEFGQCTDRFGVAWMVNIGGSEPPEGDS